MPRPHSLTLLLLFASQVLAFLGCGINKSRLATEQLVVSEAVDKAVAAIDFSALSGQKVYFDTQYLDGLQMGPNGNVKYVVSSLRQQMMAYDLRLQEKPETADYVVEGRVGVLANDGYEVTYGIPGNAAAASATALLASPVPVAGPTMPELSLGRRNHQAGSAKVGLFAYDRVTREPVWQAGVKRGASDVRDTWFMGLGPYQTRTKKNQRGSRTMNSRDGEPSDSLSAYSNSITFERAVRPANTEPQTAPQPLRFSSSEPPAVGSGLQPATR